MEPQAHKVHKEKGVKYLLIRFDLLVLIKYK